MALVVVVILVLLALVIFGCNSVGNKTSPTAAPGTSRETAVQTPDHTGKTWFEKGAAK